MTNYIVKVERTRTVREITELSVEAPSIGEADRLVRDTARQDALGELDWNPELVILGLPVVADVEEAGAAFGAAV